MSPTCLISTARAAIDGAMIWGIFSWYTLKPILPLKYHLGFVVNRVLEFKNAVSLPSGGHFQLENALSHKSN